MNETDSNEGDELARVVEAFIDMSVPEGPAADVKERLLADIGDEGLCIPLTPMRLDMESRPLRRLTGLAAAVLVIVAVSWIFAQMSTNPNRAFAQMLEQIQSIRTATFATEVTMEGLAKTTVDTTLLEPAWMRQEIQVDGVKIDTVQIFNLREGKAIALFPKEKVATLIEIAGIAKHHLKMNIIDDFRKIAGDEATFLGRETVDGVDALQYQVDRQGEYYRVWLHPDSNLPVKIEMADVSDATRPTTRITMTDFVWNPEIDESVFSFDPPEGYELKQLATDAGETEVDHFLTVLQFVTRLNDDEFLEKFNAVAIVSTIQKQVMVQEGTKEERKKAGKEKFFSALGRPNIPDMDLKERMAFGMELGQVFGQGVAFYEQLLETHHWHYEGKGIKLGEADKIVAWWYPKKEKSEVGVDLDTAHVLYGDLRIDTMPVDELSGRGENAGEE